MDIMKKAILAIVLLSFCWTELKSNCDQEGFQEAVVHFSLDACLSIIPGNTSIDYSEFTADITQQSFANIGAAGNRSSTS